MRMDQGAGETVGDLLRRVDERDLVAILRDFGEERYARRIAGAILRARDEGALDSTTALAAVVARALPHHERTRDPATRTFQALRIAVNRELEELDRFLAEAAACVRPGGRLVVIAFHSLEDRIVKWRFRSMAEPAREPAAPAPVLRLLTRRPLCAGEAERARNPRARSAKLRAAERL
jgi:16S rRNA (cytosine1402-N4)-methyltransferase